MRMKTQRILAAMLSLVLLLALAPAGWAVDLTTPNTVKVSLVSQTDYATDIVKANITVDFYLIANAEPVTGYDTYALKVNSPYSALKVSETAEDGTHLTLQQGLDKQVNADPPDFDEIVELLAEATLKADTPAPTPVTITVSEDKSTITASGLAAGMYLMVPHGAVAAGTDITGKTGDTGYVKTITTGEGAAAQTLYRTRAYSEEYEYTFKPQLVTVPGKEKDGGVPTYKTDEGTWTYTVPVNVKAEREARYGDLRITKTLNGYFGTKPAIFIFDVVAERNNKTVFSDSITLKFSGNGTKTATLVKKIPVGAKVTVTEVYSSSYKQIGNVVYTLNGVAIEEGKDPTVAIDKMLNASFVNGPGENPPGEGIVNHVDYQVDETGENWVGSKPTDNSDNTGNS